MSNTTTPKIKLVTCARCGATLPLSQAVSRPANGRRQANGKTEWPTLYAHRGACPQTGKDGKQ